MVVPLPLLEQASQRHTVWSPPIDPGLQLCQVPLKGPDGPALCLRQGFDGLSLVVQGADVSQLHSGSVRVLFDPAQGEPLGSAHVGAVFVDPARTRLIEECTGAFRMRFTAREQVRMMASNVLRFDVEDRQIVDTALMASPAALETCRMDRDEWPDPLVHLPIDTVERAGQLLLVHLIFFHG